MTFYVSEVKLPRAACGQAVEQRANSSRLQHRTEREQRQLLFHQRSPFCAEVRRTTTMADSPVLWYLTACSMFYVICQLEYSLGESNKCAGLPGCK